MGMANSQHYSALHAQRRMREAQNGTAGTAAQQAQQWQLWFRTALDRELNTDQGAAEQLYKAIGKCIADCGKEMRARFDPQITALKEENAALKGRIEKLEQKFAVAEQVEAAITKLDARALAREEGRRGKMGPQGQRGEKGERGLHGEKGEPGKAAEPVYIKSWQVDRGGYRASPVYSNGHVGGVLEIREFYEQFLSDRGEW